MILDKVISLLFNSSKTAESHLEEGEDKEKMSKCRKDFCIHFTGLNASFDVFHWRYLLCCQFKCAANKVRLGYKYNNTSVQCFTPESYHDRKGILHLPIILLQYLTRTVQPQKLTQVKTS